MEDVEKNMEDAKLYRKRFNQLVRKALPELGIFIFVSNYFLVFIIWLLNKAGRAILSTNTIAITSANASRLFSLQGIGLAVIAFVVVLFYIAIEVLSHIYYCQSILESENNGIISGFYKSTKKAILSIKKFINPRGFIIILFIAVLSPIIGFGFSISLTNSFYIPSFIMEVIESHRILLTIYIVVVLVLLVISFMNIFCIHGILIDDYSPKKAQDNSKKLIKENIRDYVKTNISIGLKGLFLILLACILFYVIPYVMLSIKGENLPNNYYIDIYSLDLLNLSDLQKQVLQFRFFAVLLSMGSTLIVSIVQFFITAYVSFNLTYLYMKYTDTPMSFEYKNHRGKYGFYTLFIIGVIVVMISVAGFVSLGYNEMFGKQEDIGIVAHRTGGYLAFENSIEGIEKAIENGCYASETDVQRTKDGKYIINHDDNFSRLFSVSKSISDMTYDEIMSLRTTYNNKEERVYDIEELLDASKDRIKLFIELKGKSADHKMVDDLMQLIKEKDCLDDVALISLNYDAIAYAEDNYPEVETGVLIFAAYGDVENMHCDMLMMEEESVNMNLIRRIHEANKKIIVWTVNNKYALKKVLDRQVDGIITDDVSLALEVKKELAQRSEYEVIEDKMAYFWE